jgi:hypothetical protein
VIGYVVYVGTEAATPRESYQVSGTSFVYPNVAGDRPYFFSVAAYSAGSQVGSRSEEVLFLRGGDTPLSALSVPQAPPVSTNRDDANRGMDHPTPRPVKEACVGVDATECYVTAGTIGDFGRVDSLRALGDGRLMLIENGARILVVDAEDGRSQPSIALSERDVRLVSLAIDPEFLVTRLVYVAEAESSPDGGLQMSVARYREVNGILGERAVVLSGLPLSHNGHARIALDRSEHLFVALPQTDRDRDSAYAGMLLRLRSDGSLPADNRAVSPIFARGVSDPAVLAWEPWRNSLWLADARSQGLTPLERIRQDAERVDWPAHPDVLDVAALNGNTISPVVDVSFDRSDASALFRAFIIAGEPAALLVTTEDADGTFRTFPFPSALLEGEPIAAVHNRGELDVAVRIADVNSRFTSRIVRLERRSSVH